MVNNHTVTWPSFKSHVTVLKIYISTFKSLMAMNLWLEGPQGKSTPCHLWCPFILWKWSLRYLICHVISQSYVIEGSCNSMSGRYSWCATKLTSQVAISVVAMEVLFFEFVTWSRKASDQRFVWFYGWKPFVSSFHKHFDCRDVTVLVFHVILQNHVIKMSCDSLCGTLHNKSPPCQVWWQ